MHEKQSNPLELFVGWHSSTLDPGSLYCVREQDTSFTVPLSTQVYKWVASRISGNLTEWWEVPDLRWPSIPSREGSNTPKLQLALLLGYWY